MVNVGNMYSLQCSRRLFLEVYRIKKAISDCSLLCDHNPTTFCAKTERVVISKLNKKYIFHFNFIIK